MLTEQQKKDIAGELKYHTSRSGGKGGQNVNKVESKVDIEWNAKDSAGITETQKHILFSKMPALLEHPIVRISAQNHRSQLENKIEARRKLFFWINKFLKPVKKRKPTIPTLASKRKRAEMKKKISEKKESRKKWARE